MYLLSFGVLAAYLTFFCGSGWFQDIQVTIACLVETTQQVFPLSMGLSTIIDNNYHLVAVRLPLLCWLWFAIGCLGIWFWLCFANLQSFKLNVAPTSGWSQVMTEFICCVLLFPRFFCIGQPLQLADWLAHARTATTPFHGRFWLCRCPDFA
jgi:hypothetical protein